jgi:hypothetical protein
MVTCARMQSSHAAWCWLVNSVVVRFRHHHVLSGASCVFIHPSSRRFVLVLSFWISSCTCCGTISPFSLYWHHVHLLYLVVIALLLTLLHGFTPVSRTEHIPKYSSIEKFIKLPFQQVLIRLNRSPNEGAMAVSLQHCVLSRISACATIGDSTISACRNLRLPYRLIRWNVDFMELLKIQKCPIVFCWGCARIIILFVHGSKDVRVVFMFKSFRAPCHTSLGFKNHYHRCMSMMVMESFSIVLDKVVSETYSLNIQTSKRN